MTLFEVIIHHTSGIDMVILMLVPVFTKLDPAFLKKSYVRYIIARR